MSSLICYDKGVANRYLYFRRFSLWQNLNLTRKNLKTRQIMAEFKFDKEELKNKAGAAMENIKQLDKEDLKNKAGSAVESLKQDVSDDEVQKNLDRLPIKNEYVKKYFTAIPAALSLIFTAFPFIKCSANNIDTDFSVLSTLGGEHTSFVNYFLLILPALVIASMFVVKLKPFRSNFTCIVYCF